MPTEREYVEQILAVEPYECHLGYGLPCPHSHEMLPIIKAARAEHPYSGVFWAMTSAEDDGRRCPGAEVHFDAVFYMENPNQFDDIARREKSRLRFFEQDGLWHAETIASGYQAEAASKEELLAKLEADFEAGVDMGTIARERIDWFKYVKMRNAS